MYLHRNWKCRLSYLLLLYCLVMLHTCRVQRQLLTSCLGRNSQSHIFWLWGRWSKCSKCSWSMDNDIVTEIELSNVPLCLLAAYFVFNIQYPKGCKNVYTFLEFFFMGSPIYREHFCISETFFSYTCMNDYCTLDLCYFFGLLLVYFCVEFDFNAVKCFVHQFCCYNYYV